jgi:CheY-like chemotaxis protein
MPVGDQDDSSWPPPANPEPYVLVADADARRAATCVAAIEAAGARARVAADGPQALALVERYGAPTLLIVDLSLPNGDGFAAVGAAGGPGRDAAIIAWAASRGVREFAAAHPIAAHARVLGAAAPAPVVCAAIERALEGRAGGEGRAGKEDG